MMRGISLLKMPGSGGGFKKEDLQRRLDDLLQQPDNQSCADCNSKETPTSCSLMTPPPGAGKGVSMGVFCCHKCCSYHYQLGRDVCTVKNLKNADDWTDEEVKALETSGNALANVIYEAKMGDEKEKLSKLTGRVEDDARTDFMKHKYQTRKFFSIDLYQKHVAWCEMHKVSDLSQRLGHEQEMILTSMNLKGLSHNHQDDENSNAVSAGDLGYEDLEQKSLADSSGVLSLGYDEEDLARTLAQRAMCSGGAIRRGSFNRGLGGGGGTGGGKAPRRGSRNGGLMNGGEINCTMEDDSERSRSRRSRSTSSSRSRSGSCQRRLAHQQERMIMGVEPECESEVEDERQLRRRNRRHNKPDSNSSSEFESPSTHSRRMERRGSNKALMTQGRSGSKRDLMPQERRGSNRNLMNQEEHEHASLESGKMKRRGSNRASLLSQEDEICAASNHASKMKRRGSNRMSLRACEDEDSDAHSSPTQQSGKMKRRGSNRMSLLAQGEDVANKSTPKDSKLKRKGSNRKLLVDQEELEETTLDPEMKRRSSNQKSLLAHGISRLAQDLEATGSVCSNEGNDSSRESHGISNRGSPGQRGSGHCSSDEEDVVAAERKARRRSGRRRTSTAKTDCESPKSVQNSTNFGYGSCTSGESSGPRPARRRPSLNGSLAMRMPTTPALA